MRKDSILFHNSLSFPLSVSSSLFPEVVVGELDGRGAPAVVLHGRQHVPRHGGLVEHVAAAVLVQLVLAAADHGPGGTRDSGWEGDRLAFVKVNVHWIWIVA